MSVAKQSTSNFDEWLQSRMGHGHCLVKIHSNDDMGFVRGVVTGQALVHKHDNEKTNRFWQQIRKGDLLHNKTQLRTAIKLLEGLQNGPPDMEKVQALVPEYRIRVWGKHFLKIFDGNPKEAKYDIYLFEHDGQYYVITAMAAFFGASLWCRVCEKSYRCGVKHLCIL